MTSKSGADGPDPGEVLAAMSREANGLIEKLRLSAIEGVEALQSNDVARLRRLVQDRAAIVSRADELLDGIRAHMASGAGGRDRIGKEIARLTSTLRAAQSAHAKLLGASIENRNLLISAIEESTRQMRRPAYATETSRVGKTIDFRR